VSGATEMPMSDELEYAVRIYARMRALEDLSFKRNLFTQWQSQAHNTDTTPAAILAQLSAARNDWEHRIGKLAILRESF